MSENYQKDTNVFFNGNFVYKRYNAINKFNSLHLQPPLKILDLDMQKQKNKHSDARLICIGDVQGCFKELKHLLEETIKYKPGIDVTIIVGDLVFKGPDSEKVVKYCIENKIYSVLGNHDITALDLKEQLINCNINRREALLKRDPYMKIVEGMSSESFDYLSKLPHIIRVNYYELLIFHAAINDTKSLEIQNLFEVTNCRQINNDSNNFLFYGATSDKGTLWSASYNGPFTAIYGHDAKRGYQKRSFAIGLDTNCCCGERLTAIVYPRKEIYSVEATEETKKYFNDHQKKKETSYLNCSSADKLNQSGDNVCMDDLSSNLNSSANTLFKGLGETPSLNLNQSSFDPSKTTLNSSEGFPDSRRETLQEDFSPVNSRNSIQKSYDSVNENESLPVLKPNVKKTLEDLKDINIVQFLTISPKDFSKVMEVLESSNHSYKLDASKKKEIVLKIIDFLINEGILESNINKIVIRLVSLLKLNVDKNCKKNPTNRPQRTDEDEAQCFSSNEHTRATRRNMMRQLDVDSDMLSELNKLLNFLENKKESKEEFKISTGLLKDFSSLLEDN